MYRRPKFQEVLLKIRQDMSREADYDVDLFAEMIRSGRFSSGGNGYDLSENRENSGEKEKRKSPKSET
jgi:hypothetical protein